MTDPRDLGVLAGINVTSSELQVLSSQFGFGCAG
jgi:hypothetical protein